MATPFTIPTVETERLRLRAFCAGDLDAYAAMQADPEVMRHLVDGRTHTRAEVWRTMATSLGAWPLRGYGMWACETLEDATFVGSVGIFHPLDWPEPEVAYALDRRFWGRGCGTDPPEFLERWRRLQRQRSATSAAQPECWKDLAVDVDECVGHWQTPSSLLEGGRLSLNEAVGRLWPRPEDQPIWLLTHPSVRVTGFNAAGGEVPISFDRPLVVDPDKNAVRTEDDRQAWSAVTLELAESEAYPQAPGDPETHGMAKVRAIMDAITADRKQLRRDDFGAMVRELVDRRATLKTIDNLWRELAPAQWREPGQGSPTAGLMVEDWKAYLPTA